MDWRWAVACMLLAALLGGCGGPGAGAPVTDPGHRSRIVRPAALPAGAWHVVRRGDTLYAIAWRYHRDYRDIARWNGIGPPYTIYPGQRLRVTPAPGGSVAAKALPKKPAEKRPPPQPKVAAKRPASAASPATKRPASAAASGTLRWDWPVQGPLLRGFSTRDGRKGIDIGGRAGQPVKAAAPGRVVYSGSGLRGYGQLIIVKHNETFLSAYAHNSRLLVREDDEVEPGQVVAMMGNSGTDRVMLHFEIRRNGKPVDPLKYLPRKQAN